MPLFSAIQMCSTEDVAKNIQSAKNLIKKSADNGAVLAVLPEMFPMISNNTDLKKNCVEWYEAGHIQNQISECAKENNIWVVAGTIPLFSTNSSKYKAASIIFDNKGSIISRYDKIHLFETNSIHESETVEDGDQAVIVKTPFGTIAPTVCYDIRFPIFYNHLRNLGAQIITVPSAFTVETGSAHWEILIRSRAIENSCYVIGACQSGVHASGRETYGHSIIVSPWGEILAESNVPGEDVIYAEIDLNYLESIRVKLPMKAKEKMRPNLLNIKTISKD
jgi:predicted amidohydrolase